MEKPPHGLRPDNISVHGLREPTSPLWIDSPLERADFRGVRLTVRLFAICRERVGADRLLVEVPGDEVSVRGLLDAVAEQEPRLAPLVSAVRVAVNQTFAEADDVVSADDELALIPPVSGGEGRRRLLELRREPLDPREVESAVATGEAGAIVTFQGTVRNHTGDRTVTHLEYEAYESMADAFLRRIEDEVTAQWPGARAAVLHRTGRLGVGEVSVVIAVAHPHRAEAFDACRHVIERLKQDVPIWKKEIRADGSQWVGVGS